MRGRGGTNRVRDRQTDRKVRGRDGSSASERQTDRNVRGH